MYKEVKDIKPGDVIHVGMGSVSTIMDIFPSIRNDGTYIITTTTGKIFEAQYNVEFEKIN